MDADEKEIINVKQFIDARIPLIREDYFIRNKNVQECIKTDMQLPDAALGKLQEMCNPKLLNTEDHQKSIDNLNDLDSDTLSLLDFVRNQYKRTAKKMLPFEIKFIKNLARLNELEVPEDDEIETPDAIITIQTSQALNNRLSKMAWSEDFLVLGQNYLTDLKDKISCVKSEIKAGEFSENPDQIKEAPKLSEIIESGYFFIENILYNDTRTNRNDCSAPVIKWAKEKQIGDFKQMTMQDTKFVDINIRLGFPYLYRHLGNCEHLIVFTSIKLVNPSTDCYIRSKYPITKDKTRGRFTFCWCCNKLYAKWIVYDSKFAVDDPTFLCERCLRNTHYESNETEETDDEPSNEGTSKQLEEEHLTKYKKLFNFKAYNFSQI